MGVMGESWICRLGSDQKMPKLADFFVQDLISCSLFSLFFIRLFSRDAVAYRFVERFFVARIFFLGGYSQHRFAGAIRPGIGRTAGYGSTDGDGTADAWKVFVLHWYFSLLK